MEDGTLKIHALEKLEELYDKTAEGEMYIWDFMIKVIELFNTTFEQVERQAIKEFYEKIEERACSFATSGKNESYNDGYIDAISEYDERIMNVAREYGLKGEDDE